MVLTNAIYFKGSWADQFDKALTENASFWTTPDKTVEASMMTHEQEFGYAETDDLQILELPTLMAISPAEADFFTDLYKITQELVVALALEKEGYTLLVNGGAYQDVP